MDSPVTLLAPIKEQKELKFCLLRGVFLQPVNSSFLNINHDITDGTAAKGWGGLTLILLNEKLAGMHVGFDLTFLFFSSFFFKHSKWEAKNRFHLGAIKWIPESLAPARRRSSFPPTLPLPPAHPLLGFITHFLSLAPAEGMLTFLSKPHFQRHHTGTTVIKCKPVLP